MVPPELLPTRLVFASERPKVVIEEARPPSPFGPLFFLVQIVWLRLMTMWTRFTPAEFAGNINRLLLPLGVVGSRLRQVLGMRSGQLPAEFAAALASYRDRGRGFPFATVRRTVERELGGPLERYFEEFVETPFTATTSFQLHRARLRQEKVWVVVKVLQPYAEQTYVRDIALLRRVTSWLSFLGIYPKVRWLDLCREVEDTCARELDLRFEAAALRQLRQTLPHHGVYVPEVFSRYSGKRILVMEFIPAALMADFIELKRTDPARLAVWLEENNIRPRELARRFFHSVWRQILEDNFFHADMTPYNVVLLRDSRLAVIDCRSVGELEAESLAKQRRFLEALADGDYATAAEYSFLLASRLPLVDLGEVKADFIRVWRRWETRNYIRELPAADKSITRMLAGIGRIMHRYRFEAQWSMVRLASAVVNADTSILQLASDVNYLQWLRQYFRAATRRRNHIRAREMGNRAVLTLEALLNLPRRLAGDFIAQQEMLRRQARVFQGTTTKSSHVLAAVYAFLTLGIDLIAALLVCAVLEQHHQADLGRFLGIQLTRIVHALPALSYGAWLGILTVVFVLHRRTARTRRSYLQRDVSQAPEARAAI